MEALGNELMKHGVRFVTPLGGLGCHLDAKRFVDHLHQEQYPAAALNAAVYTTSGIRGMERGTMSEQRNEDGTEHLAEMELVRLAVPKRVFSLSQIKFAADRITWLYNNHHLIGGMEFSEEPPTLRFFPWSPAPYRGLAGEAGRQVPGRYAIRIVKYNCRQFTHSSYSVTFSFSKGGYDSPV